MVNKKNPSICIVSPFPPPLGGMAIQAEKLVKLLRSKGFNVSTVRTNTLFPDGLRWASRYPGARTLINLILFLRELGKAARNTDVVYFLTGFFNFFFWVTYPAIIYLKINKKRVLLSARGGGAGEFFKRYRLLLKPIITRVDTITTPSEFLKDAFVKFFGIEPVVIPNIIDLHTFKFKKRNPLRPHFIVTRSLEPIYNVRCVVLAFEKIVKNYPDAKLGIVGDGSARKKLEHLISQLNLCESVTFYGRVPHERLPHLYNKYDIFLNASNVDNLPATILEAFACGLPVVSTNPGGIPYMVDDGVTGFLVEKNDCDALAHRAIYLLENQAVAVELIENARKECEKYSPENVARLLMPLLRNHIDVV